MEKDDLPSDSDESDVDYAPSGDDSNPASEIESDDDVGEEGAGGSGDEGVETKKGKRKRKQKGGKKKAKRSVKEDEEEEEEEGSVEQKQLTEEEEKKKTDDLWSDFLSDTAPSKPKPSTDVGLTRIRTEEPDKPVESPKKLEKEKVTVTKVFEFAGEEVQVTKEVAADSAEARLSAVLSRPSPSASRGRGGGAPAGRAGGLSALLGQLGKKQKIGTLEKSKLDWDRFKSKEGIDDEIQTHNRGKEGYLEKQDFLQRTDLRQFEIEKDMRTTRRSNR